MKGIQQPAQLYSISNILRYIKNNNKKKIKRGVLQWILSNLSLYFSNEMSASLESISFCSIMFSISYFLIRKNEIIIIRSFFQFRFKLILPQKNTYSTRGRSRIKNKNSSAVVVTVTTKRLKPYWIFSPLRHVRSVLTYHPVNEKRIG